MTSVDSGVETGNDSNDSSTLQHGKLTTSEFGNVSTTVTITLNDQNEVQENEPEKRNSTQTITAGPVGACPFKVLTFKFPPMNDREISYANSSVMDSASFKRRNCEYQGKIKLTRGHTWQPTVWVSHPRVERMSIEKKMKVAAATNNTILMESLLTSGVSPNIEDEVGRTPLHLASSRGYTEMVRLLLEYGADPNVRDSIGNTPLHLAAVASKISVVTLLLQAGTDVLSADIHGYNPLQLAQTRLRVLQHCKGEDMRRIKEEVHNVVSMLFPYLQKQKDAHQKMEALTTFCSRLSLSNTSDQVQDDVKDLLANLDALRITS